MLQWKLDCVEYCDAVLEGSAVTYTCFACICDLLTHCVFTCVHVYIHALHNTYMQTTYRFKLLKWWVQSFLIGVPKIVCGFRDDSGIVQKLETFRTLDIPKQLQVSGVEEREGRGGRGGEGTQHPCIHGRTLTPGVRHLLCLALEIFTLGICPPGTNFPRGRLYTCNKLLRIC